MNYLIVSLMALSSVTHAKQIFICPTGELDGGKSDTTVVYNGGHVSVIFSPPGEKSSVTTLTLDGAPDFGKYSYSARQLSVTLMKDNAGQATDVHIQVANFSEEHCPERK